MHGRRRSSRPPTPPPHSGKKITPNRNVQTTATAATGARDFEKPKIPERSINANRIILIFVIVSVLLGGIAAVTVVFLLPYFQGPCSFSETPSEYDILLCERYTDGMECSFDVNQCDFDCVLGYEQDEYECPKSCHCATKGTIESDISFTKVNVQSVLTAFITEEDSSYQDLTGSVSLHQNIWNNSKNGRVHIPFVFSSSILTKSGSMDAIRSAIGKFSASTCVDFVPHADELDFVEFVGDRKGCRSAIGRVGGRQEVWISDGCEKVGTILHQLMHVLGFWHEQSRPDRDVFVTVQYDNIAQENKHNFKKLGKNHAKSMESSYDLSSIMHFDGYSFSKNSMPTIVDKSSGEAVVTQRSGLSTEDIADVNQLYQCVITPNMNAKQDGDHWGRWNLWHSCSASCGKGQSVRVRECLDSLESIVYNGRCGESGSFEARECSGPTCTVGTWGEWSSCSVTCGEGMRHRASCCHPDVEYETEACTNPDCPPDISHWNEWEPWGPCSHSCGTGWHRRSRQCIDVTWKVVPSKNCPVVLPGSVEIKTCATQQCNNTAAPGWGLWAPWSSCSRSCDSAIQMRHRKCPPGGKCDGVRSEMTPCSLDPCPPADIPEHLSIWGPWSGWSLCSKTCGEGAVSRKRFCYGENYEIVSECLGSKVDSRDETELGACFKQPCVGEENVGETDDSILLFSETSDETGLWSLWLSWSECSSSCGTGTIERTRICIGGKVGETGCIGTTLESTTCEAMTLCNESGIAAWGEWEEWSTCSQICNGMKVRYRTCFEASVVVDTCSGLGYQTVGCNDEDCIGTTANNTNMTSGGWTVSLIELSCVGGWVASLDFNGDGLGDIVCVRKYVTMQLLENRDSDFVALPEIYKDLCISFSGTLLVGDFDGDGSGDIICFDRTNKNSRITFSREGGFSTSEHHDWSFTDFCTESTSKLSVQHMNTDSKSDLVCVDYYGTVKVIMNEWS